MTLPSLQLALDKLGGKRTWSSIEDSLLHAFELKMEHAVSAYQEFVNTQGLKCLQQLLKDQLSSIGSFLSSTLIRYAGAGSTTIKPRKETKICQLRIQHLQPKRTRQSYTSVLNVISIRDSSRHH
jgi:hypothetical protein